MQEVLLVYQEVSIYADGATQGERPNPIDTVSVDELKLQILKGIDALNSAPVVFRWNKFDLESA